MRPGSRGADGARRRRRPVVQAGGEPEGRRRARKVGRRRHGRFRQDGHAHARRDPCDATCRDGCRPRGRGRPRAPFAASLRPRGQPSRDRCSLAERL